MKNAVVEYAQELSVEPTPKQVARFHNKYIPEPNTGCWLWLGSLNKTGYGIAFLRGVELRAHRYSYAIHVGTVPPGMVVMHTCDVRCCVNPAHLRLGTHRENIDDKLAKGRARGGTVGPKGRRLNPDLVYFLRCQRKDGVRTADLAASVDMRWEDMWKVLNGQSWSDVPMP